MEETSFATQDCLYKSISFGDCGIDAAFLACHIPFFLGKLPSQISVFSSSSVGISSFLHQRYTMLADSREYPDRLLSLSPILGLHKTILTAFS
jgi:hypothetical protein